MIAVDPPLPAQFKVTGDNALVVAWLETKDGGALLILEDGRLVRAALHEMTIDYRYEHRSGRWIDVSATPGYEGDDADSDQEAPDDGSEEVSG